MSRHELYIRSPSPLESDLKDTSPTSDEFTEDSHFFIPLRVGSSQSWVASSNKKLSTAHLPHISEIHMEIKNPLTGRRKTVCTKSFETEEEKLANQVRILEAEKQASKERIAKLEKEARETRRLRIVLREKDKEIQKLRISLELAMHESSELRQEINELINLRMSRRSNDTEFERVSSTYEGRPISTHEFYSFHIPRRAWKDPCPIITEQFESFESKLRSFLKETQSV
jgi:hypothetical protein